jgi:hypothetical protein
LFNIKCLKAALAKELVGINAKKKRLRLGKTNERGPEWDIYEKLINRANRRTSQLQKEHKHFLIYFFDKQPQVTRRDTVVSLTSAFEGFALKESQVGTFIKNECKLTVKRITRHPEIRKAEITFFIYIYTYITMQFFINKITFHCINHTHAKYG